MKGKGYCNLLANNVLACERDIADMTVWLAESSSEFSSESRYIRVVFSEVCPKHSLITRTDKLLCFTIIAQVRSATWVRKAI